MLVEEQAPEPPKPARVVQLGLFGDAAAPRVNPVLGGSHLERLTWRDHVEFGDSQTPASALPAWKLGFHKGDRVVFNTKPSAPQRLEGVVVADALCPKSFSLPVMVQVEVRWVDGFGETVLETTTVPATAIAEHAKGARRCTGSATRYSQTGCAAGC